MRVRYFPHTHASNSMARQLSRMFEEVAVIVASSEDPVPQGLTAIGPSEAESVHLTALLAQWRSFSGLHQEGLATYASRLGGRVDPLDGFQTSQIKEELMRQVEGRVRDETCDEKAITARALLSFAVEHDLRCDDLNRDLERIQRMQDTLLDTMKGEVPEWVSPPAMEEDPGEVKMFKRLAAWATLFVGEGDSCRDRVFVTKSHEALALLEEYGCPLKELGAFSKSRLSNEFLAALLSGVSLESILERAENLGEEPVRVRIFIAYGEHPYNLFNEFNQGVKVSPDAVRGEDVEIEENTLFVLLESDAPC